MRGAIIALVVLWAAPAMADDLRNQIDDRHQHRAFWLNSQAWPATPPDTAEDNAPKPKFTKTYVDGVVSRFSLGGAGKHFDLFEQKIGKGLGIPAPAVVGTFDHGAAMVEIRWNSGE